MVMDGFADFIYVFVESQVLVEPDSETLYAVTGHDNTTQNRNLRAMSTCCRVPMNNISDLVGFRLRPLWVNQSWTAQLQRSRVFSEYFVSDESILI